MGSDWSCPCTDRERVKYKLPKNNLNEATEERLSAIGLEIRSIRPQKLMKIINEPQGQYILSSISNHPGTLKALVISQFESELEYPYLPGGYFTTFPYRFDSPDNLAGEIQAKCSQGYSFIGGAYDSKNIILVYYETENKQENRITVKMETDFTLKDLKTIFQEETDKMFLGCIQYKESALLIFEQSMTPRPITYLVAEFPKEEIESKEFEAILANKIHECVQQNKVHFRACISYKHSLYLSFIQ